MESCSRTLKVERVYPVHYRPRAHTPLDIVDWIEGRCNRRRLHSSVGYRTPVAADHRLMAAWPDAGRIEAGPTSTEAKPVAHAFARLQEDSSPILAHTQRETGDYLETVTDEICSIVNFEAPESECP